MTKHALPHGMPTMDMNATTPTSHHARPINAPPRMNHRKLPIARIEACPEFKHSGCRLSPARFDFYVSRLVAFLPELNSASLCPAFRFPIPRSADRQLSGIELRFVVRSGRVVRWSV